MIQINFSFRPAQFWVQRQRTPSLTKLRGIAHEVSLQFINSGSAHLDRMFEGQFVFLFYFCTLIFAMLQIIIKMPSPIYGCPSLLNSTLRFSPITITHLIYCTIENDDSATAGLESIIILCTLSIICRVQQVLIPAKCRIKLSGNPNARAEVQHSVTPSLGHEHDVAGLLHYFVHQVFHTLVLLTEPHRHG